MILICQNCGIEFNHSQRTRKFCSRKCYSENIIKEHLRICQNCGEKFRGDKNQKCCSFKCHSEKNRTKIKCLTCGKIFSVENYELKKRNVQYCSRKCYKGEGEKIIAKCNYCNKEIKRLKCRIKSDIVFCNWECKSKWQSKNLTGENNPKWLGGWEKYYGANWNSQKNLIRKRDDYTCQICGTKENGKSLDVHHKIPFRIYGVERYKEANDLNNLITLCNFCHSKIGNKNEMLSLQ